MTRRVRFSPRDRVRSGVFSLSLLLASAGSAPAAEVPFGPAAVVGTPSLPMSTAPGDLDRDGDLDFASAGRFGVVWHENVGGAGSSWTSHTVATTTIFTSIAQGDVDRDGDVDLVATLVNLAFDRIFWYENTAGNGSAWTLHTIETGIDGPRHAVLADVDGDGDPDVVWNAVNTAQAIYWHENVAGNGASWIRHTIATGVESARNVSAVDVDRDGDLDVVAASQFIERKVAWYENLDGQGGSWAIRTIATPSGAGLGHAAADVDGDGDVDVVTTPTAPGPLYWFENADGHGAAWARRTIATLPSGVEARDVTAADVDGDGDMDVMAPHGSPVAMGRAVWYENVDGSGTAWIERTIGTIGPGAYQVVAADVDGDGDQDAASVSFYGNEVVWYRNQSIHPAACFVPQPDIASGPDAGVAPLLAMGDIDGDGDLDAASGGPQAQPLTWHRNLAGDGSAWASQTIGTAPGINAVAIADFDRDGSLDIAIADTPFLDVSVFRNVADDGTVWSPWAVSPTPFFNSRLPIDGADFDRDGDLDILVLDDVGGQAIRWLANAGPASPWLVQTIATGLVPRDAKAADVDGDGDLDVIGETQAGLSWFENLGGGTSWSPHAIASAAVGGRVLIGDVDGDGDPDLLSSPSFGTLIWLENRAGNGSLWVVHNVPSDPLSPAFWTDAGDVDGDGDLDGITGVFAPGIGAPYHVDWQENISGDGSVWARHTIITTLQSTIGGWKGDVDSDGDLDVLSSRIRDSTVGWARNDSGQVLLALADQVPPAVGNDDVFSMLRITVTHGGRAGESDLELARLGLRFQEDAASDPLSTAEANALVEELRVYRDANGNGTFEPGTDTLVTTVATLSLTNGVQSIPFADGDPNVQVAFGTPATFFVVAQLTANASEQAPNQFRVVHLATGASATVAEDRSADLPLRNACPSDFDSRIIGPVVPVELMDFTIE